MKVRHLDHTYSILEHWERREASKNEIDLRSKPNVIVAQYTKNSPWVLQNFQTLTCLSWPFCIPISADDVALLQHNNCLVSDLHSTNRFHWESQKKIPKTSIHGSVRSFQYPIGVNCRQLHHSFKTYWFLKIGPAEKSCNILKCTPVLPELILISPFNISSL